MNRRSWDSSKLESQIEEEPLETLTVSKDDINVKPSKTPEILKREEKDGMLSKLKNFRKGTVRF